MKQRWSVRTYLWSLALAVALPCAAVLVYSIVSDARHDERQARATTLALAQLVASQTQQFITDAENVLSRLAQRPLVRALDPARRPANFENFLDLHPQYANLVLCNATGRVIHSSLPLPAEGAQPEIHAAWAEAVVRNKKFTVGEPVLGQISQRWVCVLGQPVRNAEGEVAGALGMAVDLERFQAPTKLVSLPPNSLVTIVDEDGTVIARSVNPRAWVGRDGSAAEIVAYVLKQAEGNQRAHGLDGEERIYGFTRIPRIAWRVYVGIPTRYTFAAARASAWRAGLLGAVVFGVVLALVLALGSRINRPMSALYRATTAVAEGNLGTTVPTTGPKEIASVAESFNRMLVIRRQKEAEVEKLHRELEQRVEDRTIQLEVANQELEAFAYSVSHDLRAPLRGIEGYASALEEDHGPKLNEEARGYLERIRSGVRRMSQLIEGLLNLSRISRSEMVRGTVSLSALAEEILAELRTGAPERNASAVIQPGMLVSGDKQLLRVVLDNLLGNAWKFTGKETEARLEFGQTANDGETAYFVRDNGAGFDMAYRDKLFQVFQRLHSTRDFEGTGIGLATVQRIIRRHGGRIWCEGEVGKGAVFYFTLPAGEFSN